MKQILKVMRSVLSISALAFAVFLGSAFRVIDNSSAQAPNTLSKGRDLDRGQFAFAFNYAFADAPRGAESVGPACACESSSSSGGGSEGGSENGGGGDSDSDSGGGDTGGGESAGGGGDTGGGGEGGGQGGGESC